MSIITARWTTLRRRYGVRPTLIGVLLLLLVGVSILGIRNGAVEVPPNTIRDVILDKIADRLGLPYDSGLDYDDSLTSRNASLILQIRLPRVILGGLVGVGLALAGVTLQGAFRTPLADPSLIGVTSGGAIGAVTAILIGIRISDSPEGERLAAAICAFIGSTAVTSLIYRLAYRQRRTDSTALLLIGLAINAIGASYVGMATFIGGQGKVGDITFWTLGSLGAAFWRDVHLLLPVVVIGLIGLPLLARPLNLLALGEGEARHLGVAVEQLRVITLAFSALTVGVAVALVGIIGFVGLVVPHLMRLLFGPDHRWLLPASALGGASFLMGADLFARTVAMPTEVPLGVVTTLVGGPFFLFLVLLYQKRLEA